LTTLIFALGCFMMFASLSAFALVGCDKKKIVNLKTASRASELQQRMESFIPGCDGIRVLT